ncbi:MAG: thiolase domain-containing protein [Anaerolineales bacterium]|nr:thiolase domain-containing protein [Anaerolineales bacterium]
MRSVSVVGIGQLAVKKASELSLRQLGGEVVRRAMEDAGVDRVDALFAGIMLSDEMQGQKHIASLIADEAKLFGVEALQVRAAMASGAAAIRVAFLSVASGEADLAIAVGAEKMSEGVATPVLAKALDAKREVPDGATMIGKNAELTRLYLNRHNVPEDGLVNFPVVAHDNARNNPFALFQKAVSSRDVQNSRVIHAPLRLFECSPICDGAAAIILAPSEQARVYSSHPVQILASSVVTDRFRIDDRKDPLWLEAAHRSSHDAYRKANINREDIHLFEVHDAFSIMTCLQLEAAGFAEPGQGWRLAVEDEIRLRGQIPITTMGGLKARGHPIGATGLYQACEIVLQLIGRAGENQVRNAEIGMMQSVGGVASTVLTHIFGV